MARVDCEECDGTGFVVSEADGDGRARRCSCRNAQPTEADLVACGLPRRYLHCTLESFRPRDETQERALKVAWSFASDYPAGDSGILFTGACGVGKTHLAAAILRHLVQEQGVRGVFADYQDLLHRLQSTFSNRDDATETADRVLGPVLDAELLVLDDLGARRATAWAQDTIGHVLNVRYNEDRTTIVTTNLAGLGGEATERDVSARRLTLADRVDERVVSRLHEMCMVIEMSGPDHRRRHALS